MGAFEEMSAMNEIVESLGDNPPTPEEIAESEGTPKDDGEKAEAAPAEDPEDPEDGSASLLDSILGLDKGEEEKQEDETKDENKSEGRGTGDVVPKERFDEVYDRSKRNDELIAKLTAKLLDENGQSESGEGESEGEILPDGVDPDVLDYLKKHINYLDKKGQLDATNEIRKSLEPIRERREAEDLSAAIAQHVPGFDAKHIPKLKSAFDALPENEKPLYQGSVAGAVLLAKEMASRGTLPIGKKKPSVSRLASRHRSETSSAGSGLNTGSSDDEKLAAIDKMDNESFSRLVEDFLE